METLADIKQTVVSEAPVQKVWDTVSTSEGMATWFMPNDFKAEVGHPFHLQSPFGPSPCKVLEVEEQHKISFSWDTDGWVVTFLLKDLGGKTEFTVIHGGWGEPERVIGKAGEKASVIRERMNFGWNEIVNTLQKTVQG